MKREAFSVCFNALSLQNHLGGIGNYTYHLIREVRRQRPDWRLSLLIPAGVAAHFRSLEGVDLLEKRLRSTAARLLYFQLIFPFRMRRFHLLHSLGNMGMHFCPRPQVITIHDLYEHVSPERFSPLKRLLMKLFISRTGRIARALVTVSRNTHKDIGLYYPHLHAKVRVIYCGNKYPVRGDAGHEDRKDFIFVGTIEPGKNLEHILRAFALFRKKYPERLRVVGAFGWGQSHVPELLASLGIQEAVDFVGYVADDALREIYSSALALLLASNYEGFGLPAIEAMACACPVISARNSGLIEAGGDSALFFETGDAEGMARRMEEIFLDPVMRRRRILSGLEHARKFTWERAAEETIALYESVEKAEDK